MKEKLTLVYFSVSAQHDKIFSLNLVMLMQRNSTKMAATERTLMTPIR